MTASLKHEHEEFLKSLGATHVFDGDLPVNDLKTAVSNFERKSIKYVYGVTSLPETQQLGWSLLG
ncbi:hypothetical protein BDR07DRAFT_1406174 [Suillus spraguei]|nr:hypothetical protein BDR07DRAFT_1406174 [Suillus spraguei]